MSRVDARGRAGVPVDARDLSYCQVTASQVLHRGLSEPTQEHPCRPSTPTPPSSRTARRTSPRSSATGSHKSPDREAYRYPAEDGQPWTSLTWKETGDKVEKLAAGLLALGIGSEQRVGIASGTRVEWILADLAVMCAGGATTTVYPSTMAADVAYILADSECHVVFAEDDEQVGQAQRAQVRAARTSRRSCSSTAHGSATATGSSPSTTSARSVRSTSPRTPTRSTQAIDAIEPDQLATLIYTSGTTGQAQGRAPAPLLLDLRGRRHPGPADPRRGRPPVPVAADGALVRQGAALHPARLRLRHCGRRPRGQDHREPRDREADLHGCRTAHLREGARPHRHDAGRRGRAKEKIFNGRLRRRPQGRRSSSARASRSRCR